MKDGRQCEGGKDRGGKCYHALEGQVSVAVRLVACLAVHAGTGEGGQEAQSLVSGEVGAASRPGGPPAQTVSVSNCQRSLPPTTSTRRNPIKHTQVAGYETEAFQQELGKIIQRTMKLDHGL